MVVDKIVKTDAQWRAQLPAASFKVARHADTEAPFSGPYNQLHDHGLFRCICCDTALYSSDTKFESGTGWPSFWQPIAKQNVVEKVDNTLGMQPHGGTVYPLRCPPRPCVRRRPASDGPALLHEFRIIEVHQAHVGAPDRS